MPMLKLLEQICERGGDIVNQSMAITHNLTSHMKKNSSQTVEDLGYNAEAYRDISFTTIWINIQINSVLCVVQLLLFWIMLRWKPHIFAPHLDKRQVPKWPLGWAWLVFKDVFYAEHLAPHCHGGDADEVKSKSTAWRLAVRLKNLDGAVMVRFCILGLKFSMAGSLLAAFLLPWYHHARDPRGAVDNDWFSSLVHSSNGTAIRPNAFQEFNLANLKEDSTGEHFWPAVAGAYFLVLVFVHLGINEWCNFEVMKKEHFVRVGCGCMDDSRRGAAQAQRSILVEYVPATPEFRDVTGEGVKRFFARLFPHAPEGLVSASGGVHSAVVQPETGELHGKVDAMVMSSGKKKLRELRKAMQPVLLRAESERLEMVRQMSSFADPAADQPGGAGVGPSRSLPPAPGGGSAGAGLEEEGRPGPPAAEAEPAAVAEPAAEPGTAEVSEPKAIWQDVQQETDLALKATLAHTRKAAAAMLERAQQTATLVGEMVLTAESGIQKGSSTAFVTFYSVSDRVAAEQLVLVKADVRALTRHGWMIHPAPEAADVIWANAAVPQAQACFRTFLVRGVLGLSMMFWIIPITLIQVWTRIDNWNIPWITRLKKHEMGQIVYTLLASYLPVLAQMGLMYALPVLLEKLGANVELEKVKSRIQVKVVGRYLKFLMVTIYCTIVGGSLLESMCSILDDPYNIFDLLQREVPQVATYFISYVMARAGLSAPMLLIFALLSAWEEKDDLGRILIRPNYAMEASNLVLVLVLGMTYCVIAPMIMFACLAFFALTSVIYSWLFLYVYTPEYDCQGQMWAHMFLGSLFGLLFGVASLAGIASAYVGPTSGSFAACLVLFGIIMLLFPFFQMHYIEPSKFLPLEVARQIDVGSGKEIAPLLSSKYYFDPVIEPSASVRKPDAQTSASSDSEEEGQPLWSPCSSCCSRRTRARQRRQEVIDLADSDDSEEEAENAYASSSDEDDDAAGSAAAASEAEDDDSEGSPGPHEAPTRPRGSFALLRHYEKGRTTPV